MKGREKMKRTLQSLMLAGVALVTMVSTGCQVDIGGQTHPSAYYIYDDVQYFPAGSEFKLSQEAAALNEATQEEGMIRP